MNPVELQNDIARDSNDLDRLSKALFDQTALLDDAEDRWLTVFDDTMASLEEEFGEAGRKSVPEHTAISAARRANPTVYRNWTRAKRAVDRLQHQLRAKTSALSGRQSQLSALKEELRAMGGPQPAGRTFGGERAA